LQYSCNSVWSASSPARRGNSVLSTAISPMRLAQWFTTPTLGDWLVAPICSQSRCLALPLLVDSLVPLGGWLVTSSLLSAFVPCPDFIHWGFSSLPHPCSLSLVQHSTPPPPSVVDYKSLFMLFSFVRGKGGIQSA
jgi:hypothetical protein